MVRDWIDKAAINLNTHLYGSVQIECKVSNEKGICIYSSVFRVSMQIHI